MSVVKSKRTESKLEVLLVANQIAEYCGRCQKTRLPTSVANCENRLPWQSKDRHGGPMQQKETTTSSF